MQELLVENLMTKAVEAVAADCPFARVVAKMRVRELSCLVVREEDRPLGILEERNLVRALDDFLAERRAMPERVTEVMTSPPVIIRRTETSRQALELMDATGVPVLAVVDEEGALVGLVSKVDILRSHLQRAELQRASLERDLAERTRELVEANLRLQNDSLEDHLLGIANRRAMATDLEQVHEMARRFKHPYAALLIDVDFFKAYNDRYGHPAGDRVLRQIADALGDALRKIDRIYRYGGEELLVVLPETTAEGAERVAERARANVEALAIAHAGSRFGIVSVSCGVCVAGSGGDDLPREWQQVVKRADEALYRAKAAGRNRVHVATLSSGPSSPA